MKKSASILDYSYPFLDPAVWDHEQKLYSYHKDFILRLLNSMYVNYQLKQPEAWITDIRIIGSLTTSKWLFTSDMDVHMVVNLAKFIEINMPGTDPKVAFEYLDATRKEFDRAKILAPMTQHPIEYYFEVPEFITTNTSVVGVYSISQDKWLKEPVIFEADLDFEESKKQVMIEAETLAEQLDGSFGKIDRQINRITELERVINTWGPEKQQLFYNKIEEKLKVIETEILKDLELRQALIDTRHSAQDPMADIEIKFKWLQRFGFFGILTNLKNLMTETGGQVTLQELPLIDKIVSQSSIKEAFLKEAFEDPKETETDICVDLDRTIAKPAKFPEIGDPIEGTKEALAKFQEMGYNVVIYSCRSDMEDGVDSIREYLDKHDIPYDSIFEGEKPFAKFYIDDHAIKFDNWDSVLKQVEKSEKKASLHITAKIDQKYWIDPSGKEYALGPDDHILWVLYNILNQSFQDQEEAHTKAYEKADEMIQQGWARITTESDYDFAVEVADLKSIPAYLDNFIAQHYNGGGIEIDDLSGEYQDVEDPFPSIQKQVNKARRVRQVAKLFSKRDIVAQTKKVKQGDYSCVMALVPHDLAQEIVEWGVRNVPDDKIYLSEGGKLGRELESHITIKYGLLTNNAKDVRRSFNEDKPYKAKLGKVRHFQPPELPFDVLTVEIISDDLDKANKRVTESFDCATDLPSDEYKPHITIAYMKRDTAKEYIGADVFEGKEIELNTVIFSPHKGNRTYFSISHDKESQFILEKMNKFAVSGDKFWVSPEGEFYGVEDHSGWILYDTDVLEQHGFIIPEDVIEFLNAPEDEERDEDNYDMLDGVASLWEQMLEKGWIRIGDGSAWASDFGIQLQNFNAIPNYISNFILENNPKQIEIEDQDHNMITLQNPAKDDLQKQVRDALRSPTKSAAFLPSLFNAPDNRWQGEHGGDDKEIALNPDSVSDETTWYAPCTEGKPRTKEVWRQFMSIFRKPFSKSEDVTVESASEELVNIGNINLAGRKFPINVPQDLLDQYFAIAIDMSKVIKDPKLTNKDLLKSKYCDKLDHTRADLHNKLCEFAFKQIAPDKNFRDFPMVSGDIKYQISKFVEDLVPRDDLPKESAYDPKLEQEEKDALGEDQTAHEYSKDFPDPTKKNFPHNTTWDPIYQDGEPSKPGMPVTYSPEMNEDNLDQNSPGGYPRRFMGKPKGEWFSNEGEVNNALIEMFKRRNAAIDNLTRDVTAITKRYALYVNNIAYPAARTLTRAKAVRILKQRFPEAYANGTYKIVEEEFKTSSLNKQAFLQHGYWIDPNGKVYEVRGAGEFEDNDYTHWQWVSDHEEMLAQDYGITDIDDNDYSGSLVNHGWTRIGDSIDAEQWQVQVQDLHAIPKAVDNVLAQFVPEGAQIDFADSNDLFVTLEWPWNNTQGAVNRALRQALPMAASLKQAGEQSASVPDYLMDEWKTDQINNDTDEEPYINHDQRDYPYGLQDSPQDTTDFNWPYMNQPYVVRLDILENPAYRLDPFGIGEYNVTWYESLPAGDGIEATNPE